MISDLFNDDVINTITDFLFPSDEDIKKVITKLKKNKELDLYDLLILDKIQLLLMLFNEKKTRI